MQLLCPVCRTPLPSAPTAFITCAACDIEVDLSRQDTVAGKPRFLPERSFEGRTVGAYVIGPRVGAGGMGTVYRASDGAAIKFLSPWLAGDSAVLARFAREIEVLTALSHVGIVKVMANGVFEGIPWFAMPFVEGKTLRDRMDAGPMPFAEAVSVFLPLLAALGYAHERGVIHRDLKPSNVLLSAQGPLLADFGIAQLTGSTSQPRTVLTQSLAVMGTLPYMSPEQREGRTLDARSDLFSYGVMFYEALCGRLPQGSFAPPSQTVDRIAKSTDAFIMRLLRPDPSHRWPDAQTAASALRRLGDRRKARPALLAASAVGALIIGLGTWAATRSPQVVPMKVATAPAVRAPTVVEPANPNNIQAAPKNTATPQLLPQDGGKIGIRGGLKTNVKSFPKLKSKPASLSKSIGTKAGMKAPPDL